VPLPSARSGTLFGSGKVAEIGSWCADNEIGLVLIDGPVTPVQQRNLERDWKVKILDRTGLILEIFADRAQTREGVLQVELAHLAYQRTRLVRSWTHLERQRGGFGFVGGPGETQKEADRRALDERIIRIKRSLETVTRTRGLHRSARKKVPYPIVALVGYTNAGKSSLFNRLTGAGVLAQDMLFATLDPTMRAVTLPGGRQVILSDTVGFISDLPTQLVAAFRATLEEVLDADLICHVRDIAHPETEAQAADVAAILSELGVTEEGQGTMIEVWNKVDMLSGDDLATRLAQAGRRPQVVPVSALTGQGIDVLAGAVEAALAEVRQTDDLVLPFERSGDRAWLFDRKLVEHEEMAEDGYHLRVRWTDSDRGRFLQRGRA
jgi:GTP-binding protein HflX